MPKKKLSRLKIAIWLSVTVIGLLIFVGLLVLSTPDPNDTYPKNLTVRDYEYQLDLYPKHPKKSDKINYSILVKDREAGRPVADTAFVVIINKAPDEKGFINFGHLTEISRVKVISDSNGKIKPTYLLAEAGDYHINVVPAALWSDPAAATAQDKLHPEYKDQPAGPDFRVTVEK
jgi:hypothetical protein